MRIQDRVLDRYGDRIRALDSRILADPAVFEQCMDQARDVLREVAVALAGYGVFPAPTDPRRRAATRGVHPSESLRSASALFEVVLEEVAAAAAGRPDAPELIRDASLAANASIAARVREASSSYVGHLLSRVDSAHIDYCTRVSRDLHDRVGASISLAQRQLELYEVYRDRDPERAESKLSDTHQSIQDAFGQVREVAAGLRVFDTPESLEVGLRAYLQASPFDDVVVAISVSGDETWLTAQIRSELFLIVREALRNALVHAKASRISVSVHATPVEVYALIEDDGAGFDPAAAGRGSGLTAMTERARLVGGELLVDSAPGTGTTLQVIVPLSGNEPAR